MHFEIVALEAQHQPLFDTLDLPLDTTYTLTRYTTTSTRDELHSRIRNADVIIVTTVKLDAETLSHHVTPRLRYVIVSATGTDGVDLHSCKARAIHVCNCPGANLETVSEHAISLYFAARRRTVLLDQVTRRQPSEWKQRGSVNTYLRLPDSQPPLSCGDEVLGIVGYGGIGKRIAAIGSALGMKVLVAARRPSADPSLGHARDALPAPNAEDARVPFDEVLRQATVLVLSLPRTPQTLNLLSTAQFDMMHPYAVLINVARGGIVDEAALVQALRSQRLAGYATDVYQTEPAGGSDDTPLLAEDATDLNITLSPHLAWFSQRTIKNLGDILKATVEAALKGETINVIA
ncbi:D-isomer specific 2-hydroxyacid dehydrogenase [Boeremia exigua]|uniref:D-isomer specific 2-hydroxyacid dehydrogenase n=1 Tax=Boeremia exigua TaxID=749465 RepID=UPI001E8E3538|nr:D-isomer specific 2-hydroxyacid dehydrogenase [Boeremia exigua]KAH6644513.1 D-isomer specific 2-hydroxyacid dehydrogenase [Boeremia exigua]